MTYPLIGNYGVNQQDVESWRPHVAGFVIRELSPVVSNWRADFSLAEYLEQNGIPGIQGIDTRALTKKLRVRGALNGFISTEEISEAEAVCSGEKLARFVGRGLRQGSHAQNRSCGTKRTNRAPVSISFAATLKPTRARCAIRCRRRTFRSSPTISA